MFTCTHSTLTLSFQGLVYVAALIGRVLLTHAAAPPICSGDLNDYIGESSLIRALIVKLNEC